MSTPTFWELQFQKAEASIQAKIGELMQLKQQLMPFRQSYDPDIQAKANALYNRQVKLEGLVPAMGERASVIKAAYDKDGVTAILANIGDVRRLSAFAKDVKDYKDEADGFIKSKDTASVSQAGMSSFTANAGLMAALAIGGLTAIYYFSKRKK